MCSLVSFDKHTHTCNPPLQWRENISTTHPPPPTPPAAKAPVSLDYFRLAQNPTEMLRVLCCVWLLLLGIVLCPGAAASAAPSFIMWMGHHLLNRPRPWTFGQFPSSATRSKAGVKVCGHALCLLAFVSLGPTLGVRLLGHAEAQTKLFENCCPVFQSVCPLELGQRQLLHMLKLATPPPTPTSGASGGGHLPSPRLVPRCHPHRPSPPWW